MTLFKATNQPIGLCSAILSLRNLTVNGINNNKKKLLFSRDRFVKGFSSFVKIFNLGMLKKKIAQFVQVHISACTVCLIANLAEQA